MSLVISPEQPAITASEDSYFALYKCAHYYYYYYYYYYWSTTDYKNLIATTFRLNGAD